MDVRADHEQHDKQTRLPPSTPSTHNGNFHHHHFHNQDSSLALDRVPITADNVPTRSKPRTTHTPAPPGVRYRECLKNHAASVGGNIYDGCGEFMPSGDEGTIEALKCAACDCHRNFHRKEVDGETQLTASPNSRRGGLILNHLQLPPPPLHHQKFSMLNLHSSPPPTAPPIIPPMSVAFGGNESSSEDLNAFRSAAAPPLPFGSSKKRFRTKFTQEQKEKMMEFAERVGWRFQKQDEEEVERFCGEVGVKRQVLKVWMHNNKIKKQHEQQAQDMSNLELIGGAADDQHHGIDT